MSSSCFSLRLAFFSAREYDKKYFSKFGSETSCDIRYVMEPLNADSADLAEGFDAVCVFVNDDLSRGVLQRLSENKVPLVLLRCAGFNNVDLAAAKELGIRVARVPAYSPYAVAEFAMSLFLTLNRKIHRAYNRARDGDFELSSLAGGFDCHGKTMGIAGTGRIGQILADIAFGFGMKVICYDMYQNAGLVQKGARYLPLDEFLAQSDVISLHLPLNEKTTHLINKAALDKMKLGVFLINTGRGALIDTNALIDALKVEGKLGGVALDVLEAEKEVFFQDLSGYNQVIKDDCTARLLSFHNVLITPHCAFLTEEALSEIARVTMKNLKEYVDKIKPASDPSKLPMENEVTLGM